MHATIRRYEGVDTARTEELSRKVSETLVPQLENLDGFRGCLPGRVRQRRGHVRRAVRGAGPERRGDEPRGRLGEGAEARVRLPNAPRITSGKVIAQQEGVAVA